MGWRACPCYYCKPHMALANDTQGWELAAMMLSAVAVLFIVCC
jgi:hypothetical protein